MFSTSGRQFRTHRIRLKSRVLKRISESSELQKKYAEKKWTRTWHKVGKAFTATALLMGAILGAASVIFAGTFFIGVRELGFWMAANTFAKPALPPLVACWNLSAFALFVLTIQRIRKTPISWTQYACVHLPISDAKLIGAPLRNFAVYLIPLCLLSVSSLGIAAAANRYSVAGYCGIALAVLATCVVGWLMSEAIAKFVPMSPLVESFIVFSLIGLFILIVTLVTVPRSIEEVVHENLYGPVLFLPPGGFFIGVTGFVAPTFFRNWILPLLGVATCCASWLVYRSTLELADIQLNYGNRISALRKGWLRSWSRPRLRGQLALLKGQPEKVESEISAIRRRTLGSSDARWPFKLFPFRLTSLQRSCLNLLGLRYVRGQSANEFLWGLAPVPMAVILLVLNQFMSLAGIPTFMRLPLIISFIISLLDIRELMASIDEGQSLMGFSAARSIFPFRFSDILKCLYLNRLLMLWAALPGWGIAIAILAQTDIPASMVYQPPLIIAALSMLIPLMSAVSYSTSNLRSCWQVWTFCTIPWSLFMAVYCIALQMSVLGYLISMRPDAAWFWLSIAATGLLAVVSLARLILVRFDESTQSLAATLRMKR